MALLYDPLPTAVICCTEWERAYKCKLWPHFSQHFPKVYVCSNYIVNFNDASSGPGRFVLVYYGQTASEANYVAVFATYLSEYSVAYGLAWITKIAVLKWSDSECEAEYGYFTFYSECVWEENEQFRCHNQRFLQRKLHFRQQDEHRFIYLQCFTPLPTSHKIDIRSKEDNILPGFAAHGQAEKATQFVRDIEKYAARAKIVNQNQL